MPSKMQQIKSEKRTSRLSFFRTLAWDENPIKAPLLQGVSVAVAGTGLDSESVSPGPIYGDFIKRISKASNFLPMGKVRNERFR